MQNLKKERRVYWNILEIIINFYNQKKVSFLCEEVKNKQQQKLENYEQEKIEAEIK